MHFDTLLFYWKLACLPVLIFISMSQESRKPGVKHNFTSKKDVLRIAVPLDDYETIFITKQTW